MTMQKEIKMLDQNDSFRMLDWGKYSGMVALDRVYDRSGETFGCNTLVRIKNGKPEVHGFDVQDGWLLNLRDENGFPQGNRVLSAWYDEGVVHILYVDIESIRLGVVTEKPIAMGKFNFTTMKLDYKEVQPKGYTEGVKKELDAVIEIMAERYDRFFYQNDRCF